ncbi:MAG: nicotinate phosphoribosyltransferase [Desulfobacterales bacterium]|nr:nicotinate phosphoribosyltransferase [Desulfobacterales bacterium]
MNFDSALLTDLYQLTMLQGYYEQEMKNEAVFEFFVRKLPENRNFLIASGLQQVLEFLENLEFTSKEINWLSGIDKFSNSFLDYLSGITFQGDVHAMPEGTVFFPDEPILRITAPLPQAQLVETRVINFLQFQTMIASKAVRISLAAEDKVLMDFGLRRAHGAEAGVLAARASYIAGLTGTATVLASRKFDIPVFGTMAHSYILAHRSEIEAFENFSYAQPNNVIYLVDTYDVADAVNQIISLEPALKKRGITIKGIRLDSGDISALSITVRKMFDNAGMKHVRIYASGDLDEYSIEHLNKIKAPVDGFGVGTKMITSSDQPYLNCAYKLQEYNGIPKMKLSEGKSTWPGKKQVFRHYDNHNFIKYDVLKMDNETDSGKPLLQQVMKSGKQIQQPVSATQIRSFVKSELKTLPEEMKSLNKSKPYEIKISDALENCVKQLNIRIK